MEYFGKYRLEVTNTETGEYLDTGFVKNVFLDKFFSLSSAADTRFICRVVFGSGTNTPQKTDTGLQSLISGSGLDNKGVLAKRERTGNIFKYTQRVSFEGAKGAVTGNVSELGLSFSYDNTGLFTRALVKDSQGNPTTISLGANDIIKLTYDVGFTVDLSTSLMDTQIIDVGGVSTTVELHAAGYNKTGNTTNNFWEPLDWYSNKTCLIWPCLGRTDKDIFTYILKGNVTDSGNWNMSPDSVIVKDVYSTDFSFNADGTYVNTNMYSRTYGATDANGVWDIMVFTNTIADPVTSSSFYPVYYLKFTPGITKAEGNEITISGFKIRSASK